MRKGAAGALLLALFSFVSPHCPAQDSAKRKVVDRVAPAYPALARGLALGGVVRMEATVSPDGSVRIVDVKGGHPVLAQAAASAVRRWRWEPSAHESHEEVEVKFVPQGQAAP